MPSPPLPLRAALLALALLGPGAAAAREPGDPIRLRFEEGDLGGLQTVFADGRDEAIGTVEYRQQREGDLLHTLRVARFTDGSSDEDLAVARIAGGRLEALHGHQIQRNTRGEETLSIRIDVAGDRLRGSWGPPGDRESMDEAVALPAGTYWGPLVFIVLKNFAANAEDGRLAFRTIAPTPRPRLLDLELVPGGDETLARPGVTLDAQRYRLRPTLHWIVDPVIARLVPDVTFWTVPGDPPSLALFEGPRGFGGGRIVLR